MLDRLRRPLRRTLHILPLLVAILAGGALSSAAVAAPTQPQLAMGDTYSLLIKADGSLWAWGNNQYGQLGLDDGLQPVPGPCGLATPTGRSVATGTVHTLAVKTDGTLWAWGYNAYGQLGLGDLDRPHRADAGRRPTAIGPAIAAGLRFSFGLKTDGSLWAWGQNHHGQLGLGDVTQRDAPTRVGMDTDWAMVDGGGQFAAAVKTDGTLWAWGQNHRYQLGQGDVTERHDSHADRRRHGLGLGRLLRQRQQGAQGRRQPLVVGLQQLRPARRRGHRDQSTSPTQVDGTWGQMVVGDDSTLALLPGGTLWAWGDNTYGQLGQGDRDYPRRAERGGHRQRLGDRRLRPRPRRRRQGGRRPVDVGQEQRLSARARRHHGSPDSRARVLHRRHHRPHDRHR